MIRGEDDEKRLQLGAGGDLQQGGERRIHLGDLAVVEGSHVIRLARGETIAEDHLPLGETMRVEIVIQGERPLEPGVERAVEGGDRSVGPVGIEIVDPQEERRARGTPPQPLQRAPAHRRGGILHPAAGRIVIDIEPLIEPLSGTQEIVRRERRGRVAAGLQDLGQRFVGGGEGGEEPAGAVRFRIAAGEDGGDRLRGARQRGVGVLEQRPLLRQPVDVRRCLPPVAVAAEPIGAHRVDRHEQDIRPGRVRGAGQPQKAGRDQESPAGHPAAL